MRNALLRHSSSQLSKTTEKIPTVSEVSSFSFYIRTHLRHNGNSSARNVSLDGCVVQRRSVHGINSLSRYIGTPSAPLVRDDNAYADPILLCK